nr:hypothetical protein [Sulfobacillus harzensis]
MSADRHRRRQQLAVGLTKMLHHIQPYMTKITHKKSYYRAMGLASKHVRQAIFEMKSELTLDQLKHWDKLKQNCLYVDWEEGVDLTQSPVTVEQVDDILKGARGFLWFLKAFSSHDMRRKFQRHKNEFRAMIEEFKVEAGLTD